MPNVLPAPHMRPWKSLSVSPLVLSLALSSPMATLIHAQQYCTDLAKTIVYNQTKSFSLDEQQAITKADFCSEEYRKDGSARAAQIEASYKVFSMGGSANESQIREEQKKQCEGRFGDHWSKNIKSNDARTASTDALSIVGECLKLNAKGMRPGMTMAGDGSHFTLELDWNPSVPSNLVIHHVGPRSFEAYKCSAQTGNGANRVFRTVTSSTDVRTTVGTAESFLLACDRPSETRVVDGESITCFKETLLLVATNGPSATLRLPKACTPDMPGKRAANIEQRLKQAEEALAAARSQLNSLIADNKESQSKLEQLKADLAKQVKEFVVPTKDIERANCTNGDLACLAGTHRACETRGYEGGFPQEWGTDVHYIVCVGPKR
ncbi:MAG: hypothetical protein JNK48_29400 [Bryobacterales bacterium]|nr:hypothetical protein [Bryobacterales bacterium]